MSSGKQKKVIWAIDVLGSGKGSQSEMLELLQLVTDAETTVEPVYVMSPDYLRMAAEVFPEEAQSFKTVVQEKLAHWHREQKWESLTSPTLLVADQVMLRSSVKTLIDYAQKTGATAITTTTSARKGVGRVLIGSFSELLIQHSPLPVLLLNPRSSVPRKIQRVLFAYDFSPESESALVEAARFARAHEAEFIIFHQLETSAVYPPEFKVFWPVIASADRELVRTRKAGGDKWVKELKAYGVRAKFVIESKPVPVVQSILQQASKFRVNFIALASRRGAVASVISGSVCRQICRASNVPVWILHPETKSTKAGFKADFGLLRIQG